MSARGLGFAPAASFFPGGFHHPVFVVLPPRFGVLPDAEKLEYYASIGVTESVLRVPGAPRDEVMPVLDEFARSYL